ncbi:MAG TPA: hypothetical protein DDW76_00730 [Cyanobacteria bacterium UBA11369]|nr:hypothetical protein [Cyanobacteria bacterium UBA11368]HBE47360.1 hypothetical protein [Cyanobacteria bacterium UBA11369]
MESIFNLFPAGLFFYYKISPIGDKICFSQQVLSPIGDKIFLSRQMIPIGLIVFLSASFIPNWGQNFSGLTLLR